MRIVVLAIMMGLFHYGNSQVAESKVDSALDSLIIDVSSYDNFAIQKNKENLRIMEDVEMDDDFGKVPFKFANYFPVMISAHQLEAGKEKKYLDHKKSEFISKFTNIGCVQNTDNLAGSNSNVIILEANGNLPFKYVLYHGYIYNDVVVDFLKLDIKSDAELEAYLSSIEKVIFSE